MLRRAISTWMPRRGLILVVCALALAVPLVGLAARAATRSTDAPFSAAVPSRPVHFGDTRITLYYDPANFKISERDIDEWVLRSARATASFFGRFPAKDVAIALQPGRGRDIMEGEATYDPKPRIRLVLGREMTRERLKRDSTLVHEMAHLGFPDMDDAHLWLHEGLATYVEYVARAQAREIKPAEMWARLALIAQQGLPAENERQGLERTRDEDRRYYGGALFWLVADVEIRKRTGNGRGVQDAIRAIFNAGGTLAIDTTPEEVMKQGDRAVGVPVLSELFPTWRKTAVSPDLDSLWQSLGIEPNGSRTRLVNSAPLADVRRAITAQPERPILLKSPALLYEAKMR
ncbi:MAG: hypothetical protein NW223_23705 [Hyphomicrobiaceae bacterium]|nr:hypothetical protein [Hyphomicrobiaceae bacterium]